MLSAAFLDLFQGDDFWFDADQATSTVATDYRDPTHTMTVASGTLAAPAADALFSTNCKSLAFTATQWMDSNRAGSAFAAYLNGAGCTRVDVLAITNLGFTSVMTCVGNVAASASAIQAVFSSNPLLQITNDAAAGVVANTSLGPLTVNVPYAFGYTLSGLNWTKSFNGTSTSGAAASLGTSAALTFRIGAQSGGAAPSRMKWRASYGWKRVLTASERSIVAAKVLFDAGVVL